MTTMGLEYLKHKENQRSNLATERETYRSNLANETERNRSNLANEAETHRSNLAREAETNRSNVAREIETNRSNVMNELLKNKELGIKVSDVAEKIRHNQRSEDLDAFKTTVSTLPSSVKNLLGMAVAKQDPTLGKAWDGLVSNKKGALADFKNEIGPTVKPTMNKLTNFVVDFLTGIKLPEPGSKPSGTNTGYKGWHIPSTGGKWTGGFKFGS